MGVKLYGQAAVPVGKQHAHHLVVHSGTASGAGLVATACGLETYIASAVMDVAHPALVVTGRVYLAH